MEEAKELIPGRLYSDYPELDNMTTILKFVKKESDNILLFLHYSGCKCYIEDERGYLVFNLETKWYDCTDILNTKQISPTTY